MERQVKRQQWLSPLAYLGMAVVFVGVLVGVLAVVLLENKSIATNYPRGDPGGRLLHEVVRELKGQIPPGAHVLSHRYEEPRWHSCSPGRSAGYSPVQAEIVFRSSTIPKAVAQSASELADYRGPLIWSGADADVTVHYTHPSGSDFWIWTYDGSTDAYGQASSFCGGPG